MHTRDAQIIEFDAAKFGLEALRALGDVVG